MNSEYEESQGKKLRSFNMSSHGRSEQSHVRTSILLTKALDMNLEAYCAIKSKSKNEAMQELLKAGLKNAGLGLDPDREPKKITVSY
jgi:hypothetical protein